MQDTQLVRANNSCAHRGKEGGGVVEEEKGDRGKDSVMAHAEGKRKQKKKTKREE